MTSDRAGRIPGLGRAILLFGSQEVILRASSIGLSLIAARSLGPAELGRLGLAVIVSSLVSMTASCVESAAVFLDRAHGVAAPAKAAARLRLCLTLLLVAPLLFWADPLVELLANQADATATDLLRLMLVVPCLEALASAPRVGMQRALDLVSLGRIQFGATLIYVALALIALAAGLGVQGMVGAQLFSTFGATVLLWRFAPKPRMEPANEVLATGSELARGAWRLFVGGAGGFLGGRLDNLLVGKSLGPSALGLYSMAWTASRLCMMVSAKVVDATLGPVLPQLGVESPEGRSMLTKVYLHFTLAVAGFSSILVVWAPIVVPLVLGPKWLATVPAVQLMSVSVLAGPPMIIGGVLLNVTGQSHFIILSTAVHLAALAVFVPPLASSFGVTGGALGDVAAVAVGAIGLLTVLVARGVSLDWIDRRATLAAVLGLFPSTVGAHLVRSGVGGWPGEVAVACVCTAAFALIALRNPQLREISLHGLERLGWVRVSRRP